MEPKRAVHGGDFFDALGADFSGLDRIDEIINADVLDAWYDPSPRVIQAIREHLPWLIKTSPPTHGDGLRQVIAEVRRVDQSNLVIGAGSSSLMYLAFPRLIRAGQKAVILDPMYGEYAHILGEIIGADVVRFELHEEDGFFPELSALADVCADADLLVMVNPNSPTGVGVSREEMSSLLSQLPQSIRVWVDETYIDFMPGAQSLENLVAADSRLIVSKSMSKHYSLSGLRVGYLVCEANLAAALEEQSPPWAIGLIAQIAAVEALRDPEYYSARTAETHKLREDFSKELGSLPSVVAFPSTANYLLFKTDQMSASELVRRAAKRGVFLRNCDSLSPRFRGRFVRAAVKSAEENQRIVQVLSEMLD